MHLAGYDIIKSRLLGNIREVVTCDLVHVGPGPIVKFKSNSRTCYLCYPKSCRDHTESKRHVQSIKQKIIDTNVNFAWYIHEERQSQGFSTCEADGCLRLCSYIAASSTLGTRGIPPTLIEA